MRVVRGERIEIVEVKPEEKALEEKWQRLFRAVAPIIKAETGGDFLVVTDKQIRIEPKLTNVKVLFRYSRLVPSTNLQVRSFEIFKDIEFMPLKEFIGILQEHGYGPESAYALIWHGLIAFNLNEKIGLEAPVWATGAFRPDLKEVHYG